MDNFSINSLSEWVAERQPSRVIVLTDTGTEKHCLPLIEKELKHGFLHINILAGENSKSLESASLIWEKLLEHNIDRNALFINLGGGMITDLGGFCASTFKRGMSFLNIPTTLLAMVDAAIGGKTGINICGYKNQVGVYAEAAQVFIDPVLLKTLPDRELLSGFAEVIKYGLINDPEFAEELFKTQPLKVSDWLPIIENCVRIKQKIVTKDPKESGLRKILNFGHTIGHAIESYSLEHGKRPILHGEAVAAGMVAEAFLSYKKTGLTEGGLEKIADCLTRNFGSGFKDVKDANNLYKYMLNDKKNFGSAVKFVLLKSLGKAKYDVSCSFGEIEQAMDFLQTYKV